MSKIYVIHENDAWVEPLRAAFQELALPFEEWFLSEGLLDLSEAPPQGVYYNRMSASSHTRDHRYAAELTGGVLAWLESHGRRVVNDRSVDAVIACSARLERSESPATPAPAWPACRCATRRAARAHPGSRG